MKPTELIIIIIIDVFVCCIIFSQYLSASRYVSSISKKISLSLFTFVGYNIATMTPSTDVVLAVGSDFEFVCTVMSINPVVDIDWFVNGKLRDVINETHLQSIYSGGDVGRLLLIDVPAELNMTDVLCVSNVGIFISPLESSTVFLQGVTN